jgi:hypothetical protein
MFIFYVDGFPKWGRYCMATGYESWGRIGTQVLGWYAEVGWC